MSLVPQKITTSLPRIYNALGAWIFAGGFTLGVKKHFKVHCHLEETNYGVATCQKNMPLLPIYTGIENWPLDELAKQHWDFVYGNPPCAAWSVAGYTKTRGIDKWKTDPRVACTKKHFNLLGTLKPTFWAWESVTQAYTKGREFVDNLANQAIELGYSVTYLLHDAQWLGIPQVRKRFFMVCHKVAFQPIIPNWQPPPTPLEVLKQANIGEICGGKSFTPVRQFTPEILAEVEPGERLTKFWLRKIAIGSDPSKWERNKQGCVKGRPSYGHCRLPVDRPGGSIVGYGIVHPTEHRWLSTEEMQVLSGFPPNYTFTPKRPGDRASEIARGVCPPVAAWLAKSIVISLRRNVRVTTPTITLIDLRKPPFERKEGTYAIFDE